MKPLKRCLLAFAKTDELNVSGYYKQDCVYTISSPQGHTFTLLSSWLNYFETYSDKNILFYDFSHLRWKDSTSRLPFYATQYFSNTPRGKTTVASVAAVSCRLSTELMKTLQVQAELRPRDQLFSSVFHEKATQSAPPDYICPQKSMAGVTVAPRGWRRRGGCGGG